MPYERFTRRSSPKQPSPSRSQCRAPLRLVDTFRQFSSATLGWYLRPSEGFRATLMPTSIAHAKHICGLLSSQSMWRNRRAAKASDGGCICRRSRFWQRKDMSWRLLEFFYQIRRALPCTKYLVLRRSAHTKMSVTSLARGTMSVGGSMNLFHRQNLLARQCNSRHFWPSGLILFPASWARTVPLSAIPDEIQNALRKNRPSAARHRRAERSARTFGATS